MFWREQRNELYVLRVEQNVERLLACKVAAGVVRDKADPLSLKVLKAVLLKYVDPAENGLRRALPNGRATDTECPGAISSAWLRRRGVSVARP